MRLLKSLELNNYLNVKSATLDNLKDINIIIGPNNCGKTSILKALNLLNRAEIPSGKYACKLCEEITKKLDSTKVKFDSMRIPLRDAREKYLLNNTVSIRFGYNKNEIERLFPKVSEREKAAKPYFTRQEHIDHLNNHLATSQLVMIEKSNSLLNEHISDLNLVEARKKLFDKILFCPDERLQSYKEKSVIQHITDKNLNTQANAKLIEILDAIVDPKIEDIRHSLDLEKNVDQQSFITSIAEQGSGVRSLICLVTDILSEKQTKILLIDEPELGLNPYGKQAFLEFLVEESKKKQIFIATHDPTFVNPVLWKRRDVSVYLFSMANSNFVNVNLTQNKQDPNTFAGFLPHTTNMRRIHIYVEGKTDVYSFQIFLDKYLAEHFSKWYVIRNEIGIFHLAGDFWRHLLYTIPKQPYVSIVILDGDKRDTVTNILKSYSDIESGRFQLFDTLSDLKIYVKSRASDRTACPIYCLQKPELEDYLVPRPKKKENGPDKAINMKEIPKEIEWIFDLVLELGGIKKRSVNRLTKNHK